MTNLLAEKLGMALPSTVAFDYPTVEALATHLSDVEVWIVELQSSNALCDHHVLPSKTLDIEVRSICTQENKQGLSHIMSADITKRLWLQNGLLPDWPPQSSTAHKDHEAVRRGSVSALLDRRLSLDCLRPLVSMRQVRCQQSCHHIRPKEVGGDSSSLSGRSTSWLMNHFEMEICLFLQSQTRFLSAHVGRCLCCVRTVNGEHIAWLRICLNCCNSPEVLNRSAKSTTPPILCLQSYQLNQHVGQWCDTITFRWCHNFAGKTKYYRPGKKI